MRRLDQQHRLKISGWKENATPCHTIHYPVWTRHLVESALDLASAALPLPSFKEDGGSAGGGSGTSSQSLETPGRPSCNRTFPSASETALLSIATDSSGCEFVIVEDNMQTTTQKSSNIWIISQGIMFHVCKSSKTGGLSGFRVLFQRRRVWRPADSVDSKQQRIRCTNPEQSEQSGNIRSTAFIAF